MNFVGEKRDFDKAFSTPSADQTHALMTKNVVAMVVNLTPGQAAVGPG